MNLWNNIIQRCKHFLYCSLRVNHWVFLGRVNDRPFLHVCQPTDREYSRLIHLLVRHDGVSDPDLLCQVMTFPDLGDYPWQ